MKMSPVVPGTTAPMHFGEGLPVPSPLSNKASTGDTGETQFSRIAPSVSTVESGREAVVAGMTVLRVLNVARHWITKYPEVRRN